VNLPTLASRRGITASSDSSCPAARQPQTPDRLSTEEVSLGPIRGAGPALPVGHSWLHGLPFRLYLGLRGYTASSRRWPLRADRVEVTWDKSRSAWLIRITTGGEVILRTCKLPKDANEQTLRSAAQKTLQDEGYEADPTSLALEGYGTGPV